MLTHERLPDNGSRLPDVVLDNLERISWGMPVADVMLVTMVVFCFLLVIAHRHRLVVLRRVCLLIGLLYMFRALTIYITVLPVPDPEFMTCLPPLNSTEFTVIAGRVFNFMLTGGLTLGNCHYRCWVL